MGDPVKIRQKYDTPSHPWQKARIEEERQVLFDYGLKNKREIWKAETLLRDFKNQAKSLASRMDAQSRLEEKQLLDRLVSMGLLGHGDSLDKVLGLNLKNVMDRRLQAFLVKKELAGSMKQARQFITHGHVTVANKKITFPSYFVNIKEESMISFMPKSSLSKDDHPERQMAKKEDTKAATALKKKNKTQEEAPPAFSETEIVQIEETGAVEAATIEDAPN